MFGYLAERASLTKTAGSEDGKRSETNVELKRAIGKRKREPIGNQSGNEARDREAKNENQSGTNLEMKRAIGNQSGTNRFGSRLECPQPMRASFSVRPKVTGGEHICCATDSVSEVSTQRHRVGLSRFYCGTRCQCRSWERFLASTEWQHAARLSRIVIEIQPPPSRDSCDHFLVLACSGSG